MEGRILAFSLLCLVSHIGAIKVDIPKDVYEYARGDNVTLPCTFKSINLNPNIVIITWSMHGLGTTEEVTVLTYFYPGNNVDVKQVYEGRVGIDVNLATGTANLKISSVTLADNNNFECRVQIQGDDEGQPADMARLVVLVAPSTPICKIQGKAEYGQNINLTCKSEEGSPPPTYKWQMFDVRSMPRVPDPRTTDKDGILSLYNITKETSGYYNCTSSNKIRSATCSIQLSVMPPSMNIGSTAGIIAGAVIGLIILIIVIYCCCCRKKNKEEEYAMGVREEYHDKEPEKSGEGQRSNGAADRRDQYEDQSERDYDSRRDHDDRRSDYDDRRSDYDDRRRDHDDRRSDYNDRRSDYDDRRSDYDDRRRDYDDRRSDYDDRRSDYDDRRSDYNDRRDRYDDRRERYDDDHHYDRDDKPPVPANKPRRD